LYANENKRITSAKNEIAIHAVKLAKIIVIAMEFVPDYPLILILEMLDNVSVILDG